MSISEFYEKVIAVCSIAAVFLSLQVVFRFGYEILISYVLSTIYAITRWRIAEHGTIICKNKASKLAVRALLIVVGVLCFSDAGMVFSERIFQQIHAIVALIIAADIFMQVKRVQELDFDDPSV
jgi:hypothetical protein